MNNNEITTWAAKIPQDLKDKISNMIKSEDKSSREFLENVINVYELEQLKKDSGIEKDVEELQSNLTRIMEIVKVLIGRNNSMEKSFDDKLERMNLTSNDEINKLKEVIEDKKEEIAKLKQEQKEGVASFNELKKEVKEKDQEVSNVLDLNSSLKTQLEYLKKENDSLKEEINSSVNLTSKLEQLKKEKDILINKLTEFERENYKLKTDLASEIKLVELRNQNKINELKADHAKELTNLKEAMYLREQDFSTLQKQHFDEKLELLEKINNLKNNEEAKK